MATKALLVRLEAKAGKENDVAEFLRSALPLVENEPDTRPWFAVRFGPSTGAAHFAAFAITRRISGLK